ncbi:uracil-DNA glycosylase [Anaerolineales bacterium HSG24]|nr:uracil-DNA glycosylase [Anaerolineales bacterium HSG24]
MTDNWHDLNHDVITCRACPRLVAWREQVTREKRRAYQDWDYWGKPVPGFGDVLGRVLIVGLAPGAHGSNRTGRMFTGDSSGDTLFGAMHRTGFASQPTAYSREDGLELHDAFITAIGRCAPPKNRPTSAELSSCRSFFARELALMPQLEVILALGQMAFDGSLKLLRTQGYDIPRLKFGHGVHYLMEAPSHLDVPPNIRLKHLLGCYHPSRQNTQTGRLTLEMIDAVFEQARGLLS